MVLVTASKDSDVIVDSNFKVGNPIIFTGDIMKSLNAYIGKAIRNIEKCTHIYKSGYEADGIKITFTNNTFIFFTDGEGYQLSIATDKEEQCIMTG